jgi:hypothetical protein
VPLQPQQVRLVRGENNFVQTLPPVPKGFHTYAVQVSAPAGADARHENNRYSAYSVVLGKPRILIVEREPGESEALRAALSPSVDADVVPPAGTPADVRSFAGYEAVVLVNVPASSLSRASMESLQVAVRDLGKGLIVVGGDESYAVGGYFRTPLEAMLPLDLNLPSKLDIPTVGMALVIDRSGSMGVGHTAAGVGVTKLELAKEAASRAVAQLSERDYVGVITFDSSANWVIPMQKLGDPAELKGRIGSIGVGGGTNIYSGLAPAVEGVIASNAKSKHIVLLTDGVSEGGDYDGLLAKMAANGVTLSAVAVGADSDTGLLQYLAAEGKGRYYYTEDGDALPESSPTKATSPLAPISSSTTSPRRARLPPKYLKGWVGFRLFMATSAHRHAPVARLLSSPMRATLYWLSGSTAWGAWSPGRQTQKGNGPKIGSRGRASRASGRKRSVGAQAPRRALPCSPASTWSPAQRTLQSMPR